MIPVCIPLLGENEKKYLIDCIDSNWISSAGKYIKAFEEQFSRYCGCEYGSAVTNGTTALHLAVAALDLGPGDEIIMPSFAIASTAFAALYCGAKPVFVDSEPDTWNIDVTQIEKKITKRTKAIMPVHTYGHPCDMDAIRFLAKKYKLAVIEDAAEAHGAEYKGRKVGGLGDIACFSFYGNKIITCGEGGMVVTNNKKLHERCQRLKNLAFLPKRYWHEELGFNFRMTNLQAAVGLAQFENIDRFVAMRRHNAHSYNALLKDIPGITLPVERSGYKNVYWMYSILIGRKFGISRDELMTKLMEKGIETRTFFIPLHNQPIMKKMKCASKADFSVANRLGRQGLYLPSGSGLKQAEIELISQTIRDIQKEH
jgi:perosamine synthetase